jgi:hypothetical protein
VDKIVPAEEIVQGQFQVTLSFYICSKSSLTPIVLAHTMMPWQHKGSNKWEVGVHYFVGVVRLQKRTKCSYPSHHTVTKVQPTSREAPNRNQAKA